MLKSILKLVGYEIQKMDNNNSIIQKKEIMDRTGEHCLLFLNK